MDILVLQGPNLNLIGVQSAKIGERVTLDKINKELRQHAHSVSLEIQLRFLQTHKAEKAVSFIQRN
ncbi:MAG: type II 3-dehydroquinate dehydratase, partial [Candidatus Marinimicrobia bacterium]|nr:type II 3-dehydroquinate dehydratase [Candidatus Neomarinimicrobiota bacterium]